MFRYRTPERSGTGSDPATATDPATAAILEPDPAAILPQSDPATSQNLSRSDPGA